MMFKKTILLLLLQVFVSPVLWADEAVFDFTNESSLRAMGITAPGVSSGTNIDRTITLNGVSLSTTNGTTQTRVWNTKGSLTLRVYKGGSMTLSVGTNAVITSITLSGSKLTDFTSDPEGLSGSIWKGSKSSVTFSASGSCQITKIKVEYSQGQTQTGQATGTAGLKSLKSGTLVDLTFTQADKATVSQVASDGTLVSDKDGSLTLIGFLPGDAGWHAEQGTILIGTIRGKYENVAGAMTFTATGETSADNILCIDKASAAGIGMVRRSTDDRVGEYYTLSGTPAARHAGRLGKGLYISNHKKILVTK